MARKPTRIRRTFTPQFKRDAVALVQGGRRLPRPRPPCPQAEHPKKALAYFAANLRPAASSGDAVPGRGPGHFRPVGCMRGLGRSLAQTQQLMVR
jgi:hypothetical protein